MNIQRTFLLTLACLCVSVFTVQTMGRARRTNRPPAQPTRPDSRSLRGLTGEQKARAITESINDFFEQRERAAEGRYRIRRKENWMRLLRINEQEWKMIEPRIDIIGFLFRERWGGARGCGLGFDGSFHWNKHSGFSDRVKAPAPDVVIERKKIADELVGLLEDKNSKDEDIQKKIDQLHQARERARKELAEVKKEIASLSLNDRQEAILLVTGCIE